MATRIRVSMGESVRPPHHLSELPASLGPQVPVPHPQQRFRCEPVDVGQGIDGHDPLHYRRPARQVQRGEHRRGERDCADCRDFVGGVGGRPSSNHPTTLDQQCRRACAQFQVHLDVGAHEDVGGQPPESRPPQLPAGDEPGGNGRGPTERSIEHSSTDGARAPEVPSPIMGVMGATVGLMILDQVLVVASAADPSGVTPLDALGLFVGIPVLIIAVIVGAVYGVRWRTLRAEGRSLRTVRSEPLTEPVLGRPDQPSG